MALIGLLMNVPNVKALECYQYATKNASSTTSGRAAWQLNKMFRIATGNDENPLAVAIGDGHPTRQCPAGYNFCATLHCTKIYGMLEIFTKKWCKIKAKYFHDFFTFLEGISSGAWDWDSNGIYGFQLVLNFLVKIILGIINMYYLRCQHD
jgi:hypothetical protein